MGKVKKERAGKEARQQAAPMHEFQMSAYAQTKIASED
jgi:hypothetical protein